MRRRRQQCNSSRSRDVHSHHGEGDGDDDLSCYHVDDQLDIDDELDNDVVDIHDHNGPRDVAEPGSSSS
jgi:hypothetical protein